MSLYTISNKIINDPIYGLIPVHGGVAFDIISHPWFQRLRRIQQLGLTSLVYPGAIHTRFQHTLGCVYLMQQAIDQLQAKEVDITPQEAEGAVLAILLHDIGHAPFSHALEKILVRQMSHEEISLMIIGELNKYFNGNLDLAQKIFSNTYHKKFLHQLVSSQIDTDRLDYLNRDSFFTGVSEGVVSSERIIKMLNVRNDKLVVEQKGLYSIEKFLIARRLMYWQVYLHKTVVGAEQILRSIIERVRYLLANGEKLFSLPELQLLLLQNDKINTQELCHYTSIDDNDIATSIKAWAKSNDKILSYLCQALINRELFRIIIDNKPFEEDRITELRRRVVKTLNISYHDTKYVIYSNTLTNSAYRPLDDEISILSKNGQIQSILAASDIFNHEVMSKTVSKYYLCYPKELD